MKQNNSVALYQLADEFLQIAQELGELDLPDQVIADTLESISGPLEVKARNVAAFALNLEASAAAMKAAEARMAHRRQAIERRAERLKHYLKSQMERTGVKRIDSPEFCLAVRDNPPRVVVHALSQIPQEYMRVPEPQPEEPDKEKIAKALKRGEDIPGVHLETSTRVEIK